MTKKRKQYNKRKRRGTLRRKRGGFFGALKGAFNSGYRNPKSNEENISYITSVKKGFWKPITYTVEYIIPNNFVAFKNPDSFFTPRFNVHLGNTEIASSCYIRIAEPSYPKRIKFIEYFILVENTNTQEQTWYAMMRIYGLNTGFFASFTNIVFYQLTNSWFDLRKNAIILPSSVYELESYDKLNKLQQITLNDTTPKIIRLTSGFTPITNGNIFNVLRQFRNSQIINYDVKKHVTEDGIKMFLDAALQNN